MTPALEQKVNQLNAAYENWIESKKNKWTPSRNSSYNIGHACERYLTAERIMSDKKPPVDNGLQAIFEEGHDQEQNVIQMLSEIGRGRGFKVVSQQTNVSSHTDNISAKIDVMIQFDGDRKVYPIEVKSMHPMLFDKFKTLQDFKNSDNSYHKMYPAQVMSYLYHSGHEDGFVCLKDKGSKRVHWIAVTLDYALMNESKVKADRIDKFTASKKLPEPMQYDPTWCDECWVRIAGECSITKAIQETKVIVSEKMVAALKEREACYEASKKYKKLDDQVKEAVKTIDTEGVLACGDYEIEVKDSGKKNQDGSKSLRIGIKRKADSNDSTQAT